MTYTVTVCTTLKTDFTIIVKYNNQVTIHEVPSLGGSFHSSITIMSLSIALLAHYNNILIV